MTPFISKPILRFLFSPLEVYVHFSVYLSCVGEGCRGEKKVRGVEGGADTCYGVGEANFNVVFSGVGLLFNAGLTWVCRVYDVCRREVKGGMVGVYVVGTSL